MCDKYNIEYDYISCGDGSILYDKDNNIVVKFNLSKEILDKFIKLKDLVKVDFLQFSYPDDYKNFLIEFEKLKKTHPQFDFLIYSHENISYFCLKNKGINKSSTIKYLQNKFKISDEFIYTIGDNENDYDMLKIWQGYYIGNVNEKIKNVCQKGYNQVFELFDDLIN